MFQKVWLHQRHRNKWKLFAVVFFFLSISFCSAKAHTKNRIPLQKKKITLSFTPYLPDEQHTSSLASDSNIFPHVVPITKLLYALIDTHGGKCSCTHHCLSVCARVCECESRLITEPPDECQRAAQSAPSAASYLRWMATQTGLVNLRSPLLGMKGRLVVVCVRCNFPYTAKPLG